MATISYGIVLDISDITSDSNAGIGLASGVFYWITGRPGYAGSGYSGDAPGSKTWKQGIITSINRMMPMIRMAADTEISGGYGSLSGFGFEVDNTSLFWNTLESNDYHIINRPIDVYIFIDDVSYHVWGGVVSKIKYNEIVYQFICEDDFKLIHKPLPPDEVSDDNFPDANSKVVGDVIPICFGNVKYAKMIPVYTDMEAQEIAYAGGFHKIAALATYDASAKTITLYTTEVEISANQYKGYFARAVVGGSNQSIRILSNAATVTTGGYRLYKTTFTLESWFSTAPVANNAIETHATYSSSPDDVTAPNHVYTDPIWYFEIVKFEAVYIVSNDAIDSYVQGSDTRRVQIRYFDKDENDFVDTSEIRNEDNISGIGSTAYPGIKVTAKSVNLQGDLKVLFYITPEDIRYRLYQAIVGATEQSKTFDDSGDNPNLYDRDDATSYELVTRSTGTPDNETNVAVVFSMKFPKQILNASYDNVYVLMDFRLRSVQASTTFYLYMFNLMTDYMSRKTIGLHDSPLIFVHNGTSDLDANLPADSDVDFPLIPKSYYNESPDDTIFHAKKSLLDIADFVNNNKVIQAYPTLRLLVNYKINTASSGNDVTFTGKEIAFIGEKAINIINDDLYTILKGESV